jgi:hypothetical protein
MKKWVLGIWVLGAFSLEVSPENIILDDPVFYLQCG